MPPLVDVGAGHAHTRVPEMHASARFPWAFFSDSRRRYLAVWRGHASRTAWITNLANHTGHGDGRGDGRGGQEQVTAQGGRTLDVRKLLLENLPLSADARAGGSLAGKRDGLGGGGVVSGVDGAAGGGEATPGGGDVGTGSDAGNSAGAGGSRLSLGALQRSTLPLLISTRKVTLTQHYAEMQESIFCLCPGGWAQWTVRFFEAVQNGCLPVTFYADEMPNTMPFADVVDYPAFALNVQPVAIPSLRATLGTIASNRSELRRRQRALWMARAAFDWTDLSPRGAFYHTLDALARRGVV